MNQIEKTEIITGLIATVKSRLVAKIFLEEKKTNPNKDFIKDNIKEIKEIEVLSKYFYEKLEVSDQEYETILKKIKEYE